VQLVAVSWLAGSLAVVATLGLMVVLATPHPPALAIALIPQILQTSDPASFTAAVAVGAAALYLGVFAFAIRRPGLSALRSRPARRPA
jgi:CBS-domain-containing membrane protein